MHAALVTLQVSTTRTKLICHPITWRITSCVRALPSLNLTSEKERLLEVSSYLKMLEEQIHRYFFSVLTDPSVSGQFQVNYSLEWL